MEEREDVEHLDGVAARKNKSYTVTFKLEVIRAAKATSRRAAAKKYRLDPKRVREWLAGEDKLLLAPRTRRRLEGAGRQPLNEAIDEAIFQWIRQLREARQRVTRKMVMLEAKRLHSVQPDGDPQFLASEGWMRGFMARKKITLRRRTTVAQRIPNELGEKIVSYISQIRHFRMMHNYSAKHIAAMDETGLWLDMPGKTTLEEQGTRSVGIRTTGHEKNRFTVVLGARADGSKMHPMIIFKGKRKDKCLEKLTGVIIQMQDNAWMTEELTLRWLQMAWGGMIAAQDRRLLVWDDFRGHKTDRVEARANEVCNTDVVSVPPGCTSLLQAPDLCWNKPFKERYCELWDEWSISGPATYTASGNRRAPTKEECAKWVKIAWASLSTDTIIRSFKCSGITTAVDGKEDLPITCLAENPVLASDVRHKLYNVGEPQQPSQDREQQEERVDGLSLSEDSDFDDFDADDLL